MGPSITLNNLLILSCKSCSEIVAAPSAEVFQKALSNFCSAKGIQHCIGCGLGGLSESTFWRWDHLNHGLLFVLLAISCFCCDCLEWVANALR